MKDRDAKINAAIISNRMGFLQYGGVPRRSLIVDLFVTNSGKLPGAIKGVGVKFRGEKDWDYNSVLFDKDQEGKQVSIAWTSAILEPVHSRIIEVSHPTTVSDDLAGKFELQIQYFRFDSRTQKFEIATYWKGKPPAPAALYLQEPQGVDRSAWKIKPAGYADDEIVIQQWDEILRMIATIKLKEVTASDLFRRLNS
jgi:hypothetical protein